MRASQGPHSSDDRIDIDGQQWELLRDNVPSLISAVAGGNSGVNLRAGDHAQYVHAGRISAHYLRRAGDSSALGRNFSEAEDRPHGPRSAILSFSLWRNTFGADRNLLGHAIHLKGDAYTVIGVLPEGATMPQNADVYTALQPSREGEGEGTNFDVITRLRDGATWQQADAEINRAWAARAADFARRSPGARLTYLFRAAAERRNRGTAAEGAGADAGRWIHSADRLRQPRGPYPGAHVLRRAPEIATRLALGASHWHMQKQLWVENLLLALIGGLAGAGAGFLALRGLLSLLPEGFLPVAHVPLDGRVLAFTLGVSLLTSVLFGMLPALATRKVDLRSSIASARDCRRRSPAPASNAYCRGSGFDRGIAGRFRLAHPHTDPSGDTAPRIQSRRRDDRPKRRSTMRAITIRQHSAKLMNESVAAMQRIPGVQGAAVGLTLPYERALNDGVTISRRQGNRSTMSVPTWSTLRPATSRRLADSAAARARIC